MVRADEPRSAADSRDIVGVVLLAFVDFGLLFFALVWLFVVCPGGGPFVWTPDATLTALHLVHLILDIPALLLCAAAQLLVPVWFALGGLIVLLLDVAILVIRGRNLILGGGTLFCELALFLFDFIFFITAILFLAFALRTLTAYGPAGDDDVRAPGQTEPLLVEKRGPIVSPVATAPRRDKGRFEF